MSSEANALRGEQPTSSQMEHLYEIFSRRANEALIYSVNNDPGSNFQKNKWQFEINDIGSSEILDKQLNKNWFMQDSGYDVIDSRLYYLVFTRNIEPTDDKPIELFLTSEKFGQKIFDVRKIITDYESLDCLLDEDSQRFDLLMTLLDDIKQGSCDAHEIEELLNILKNSKLKILNDN